jgi:Tetracyclin repressor-like, C-terminal domain
MLSTDVEALPLELFGEPACTVERMLQVQLVDPAHQPQILLVNRTRRVVHAGPLLTSLAHLLRSAKWTSVLPSVIDAAERDPEIAAVYSRLQEGYSAPLQSIIQRAVQKGELPKTTDAALLVAALTGPLFYRRWFSREPLTSAFAKQIVRLVLRQD